MTTDGRHEATRCIHESEEERFFYDQALRDYAAGQLIECSTLLVTPR